MAEYSSDYKYTPENPLVDSTDYPVSANVNTLRDAVSFGLGHNIIVNSIFRTDTHGWTLNANASRESSVGGYPVGAASLTDANASDTYVAKQVVTLSNEPILQIGQTIVFSAYVKASTSGVSLQILKNDTGGNIATSTTHPGDGNWHRIYGYVVIPSGTTSLGLYLLKPASTSAVYGTGFMLHRGTYPAGFMERIPGDGTGRILTSDLARNLYQCRVHLNANQSIPNTTPTTILFNTTDYDLASGYNASNGKYTVQYAGYYYVTVNINTATVSGTGYFNPAIFLNSSSTAQADAYVSGGQGAVSLTDKFYCNVNDTIYCSVYQNMGASENVYGTGSGISGSSMIISWDSN